MVRSGPPLFRTPSSRERTTGDKYSAGQASETRGFARSSTDSHGLPVAVWVASGERAECQLVVDTLDARFVEEAPLKLIGDKAYDSDALDVQLERELGTTLIAPNRAKRRKTQDGRGLRRYKRRWKIERLFAWLMRFRRIVTRWECKSENFLGFVQLACLVILLRRL